MRILLLIAIGLPIALVIGSNLGEPLTNYLNVDHHREMDAGLTVWLDSQRKGETGYEYWAVSDKAARLFAVESYEIVDKFLSTYKVRIHSSTRCGIPVVCLWEIQMMHDGKILSVRNVEDALREQEDRR